MCEGDKKKFIFVTTVPLSLGFFIGQYQLLGRDFDVTVVSSCRKALEAFGKSQGVKTHWIPMEREISIIKDIYGLICFIIYFILVRPYIVHGNTPKGGLLSMVAAWIARVPVRIYMCHGLRYQGCSGFKRRLLMFMERLSCHCATDIICVSRGVKTILMKDRICKGEPVVIWNGSASGIDTEKFNPMRLSDREGLRQHYGIQKDNFTLGFIGRLVKDKGIDELIEAFGVLSIRHPEMRLLLVGSLETAGNSVSDVTLAAIREKKSIIACGQQTDIPKYLSIIDLFIFPSYREGFGLSLMEAAAMGVPSVATDITGCNEIVIDGVNGLLVKPRSSDAIVEAVENLFSNRNLLDSMRKKCRKTIVARYERDKLCEMYRDYYLSKLKTM